MKNHDFINSNIGEQVYVTGDGDLAMNSEFRNIIFNKTTLTIVKLTRGGKAYLKDSYGHFYSVPPRNVREISERDELALIKNLEKLNSDFEYDCIAQFCMADCVPCFLCEFSIKKK